jgi:DNA polymerase-3 subunit epsilon
LLAEVYLELRGGRQPGLSLAAAEAAGKSAGADDGAPSLSVEIRPPRPHVATAEELASHEAFIATLKEPMWLVGGETKAS